MKRNCSALREQLLTLLSESATSADEDLAALSQCVAHIRDRRIIADIASKCDVALTGFLSNDVLELYCNIKRGRHHLGFISKGWEDPGFRIGEVLEIGWWDGDVLKANTNQVMRCCAANGITLTIQETPLAIELQLDGVIYSEGFNRDTFLQALDSLNACVEKIHTLIPGGHHGRHSLSGCFCGRLAETSGQTH